MVHYIVLYITINNVQNNYLDAKNKILFYFVCMNFQLRVGGVERGGEWEGIIQCL